VWRGTTRGLSRRLYISAPEEPAETTPPPDLPRPNHQAHPADHPADVAPLHFALHEVLLGAQHLSHHLETQTTGRRFHASVNMAFNDSSENVNPNFSY